MVRKSRKLISTVLAALLVFGLFSAVPPTASAAFFHTHPSNSTIIEGQSATFTVIVVGLITDPVAYHWQIQVAGPFFSAWHDLTESDIFSGVATSTLTVATTDTSLNNTIIRCKATDSTGTTYSNAATLTVNAAPAPTPAATPHPTPPAAPSDLTATAGANGVTLNWKDNSNNEDGFLVDRKEGSGSWSVILKEGALVGPATTGANVTTFTDTDVEVGKTYTYRVRAFAGLLVLSRTYSAYSDEVTVTLGGAPTITGPTIMMLTVGYTSTSTGAYTVAGTPAPTVTKASGNAAITWDDANKKLNVASGLAAGAYQVVLKASNGVSPDAMLTFTLNVTASGAPSMSNFQKTYAYAPGKFSDVNENVWYGYNQQKVIANAFEYGLMEGKSETIFNPTGNMTIAEAITIAARVHSIYSTGQAVSTISSPWYQGFVNYAIDNNIITSTAFSNYTREATRAEMAYIFASSLPGHELLKQNTVNSLPDVRGGSDPATGQSLTPYYSYIIRLYESGVLAGSDSTGTFNPGNNITRAEAAAIVSRLILPATRFNGRTFG